MAEFASKCKRISRLDDARNYSRQVAAEIRKQNYFARREIDAKPLRKWGKKVSIETPGRLRDTLLAIVGLCIANKESKADRWYCEPRVASLAKRLRISERAVKKHTSALIAEGILIRVAIPGRKRTRGRSVYRYYPCSHGVKAAWQVAKGDGFEIPDGEPDEELSSPLLGKVQRTFTQKSKPERPTVIDARERFEIRRTQRHAELSQARERIGAAFGEKRGDDQSLARISGKERPILKAKEAPD